MEALIAAQNAAEDEAANMMVDAPVPTIHDWEMLMDDGGADGGPAEQEPQPQIVKTNVKYAKWKKDQLYDLFLKLEITGTNVKKSSNKQNIFDAILSSGKVTKSRRLVNKKAQSGRY